MFHPTPAPIRHELNIVSISQQIISTLRSQQAAYQFCSQLSCNSVTTQAMRKSEVRWKNARWMLLTRKGLGLLGAVVLMGQILPYLTFSFAPLTRWNLGVWWKTVHPSTQPKSANLAGTCQPIPQTHKAVWNTVVERSQAGYPKKLLCRLK